MFFCVVCCLGIAIIMGFLGGLFPRIYNTEPEIKELAKTFIVIAAALMPVYAFCHSAYFTLRSGGKTFITFLFEYNNFFLTKKQKAENTCFYLAIVGAIFSFLPLLQGFQNYSLVGFGISVCLSLAVVLLWKIERLR